MSEHSRASHCTEQRRIKRIWTAGGRTVVLVGFRESREMWPGLAITQYRKSKTLRHDRHRTYFSEDTLHELNCYRTSFHWRGVCIAG